jgi:hypothetical protein
MTTVGYYIRANGVRAEDGTLVCGEQWALIRVDDKYADEVVVDGLPKEEAAAFYWRKLEELVASRTSGGNRTPDAIDDGATVERKARRAPRQLGLKL